MPDHGKERKLLSDLESAIDQWLTQPPFRPPQDMWELLSYIEQRFQTGPKLLVHPSCGVDPEESRKSL